MNRAAFVLAALMCAASVGAYVVRPDTKAAERGPQISLEEMIPERFGDSRVEPQQVVQMLNPQTKELLDKLYSQTLSRTYADGSGYRVMLSLAYGSDQRGALQAHKPEVCYPAQGFTMQKNDAGSVITAHGDIPVRRLFGNLRAREEPITYWFTVGDQAVQGSTQKRLVDLG